MLQLVKPQQLQQREYKVDSKLRNRLDYVREQNRVSLVQLHNSLSKLMGRNVTDIGQLSNGEIRWLIGEIERGKVK